MSEPVPAIGIDLGTTYSCVGAFRNGRVEIFENPELGYRITPSCVSFYKGRTLVGEDAKRKLVQNPENTVYDMIHLIGKSKMDEIVQHHRKYWTFQVKEEDDQLFVEIEQHGKKRLVRPEEVSALVLEKMKNVAERDLRKKVTKAVITVPAYFNQAQKQGTIRAAKMAGLEDAILVSKPAAAAFAYGFDNKDYTNTNILVVDIDQETFGVAVLKVTNERFVVSAIGGDTQFGLRDFDHLLMDYFNKKIKDKHGVDCYANKRHKQRLLNECIEVKCTLSAAQESGWYLGELFAGLDESIEITRPEFNELCEPLFNKIKIITEATLEDAEVTPGDIKSVILIDGYYGIPRIKEILDKMFPGNKLNRKINADEVFAYGAALCTKKYFEDNSSLSLTYDNKRLKNSDSMAGKTPNVILSRFSIKSTNFLQEEILNEDLYTESMLIFDPNSTERYPFDKKDFEKINCIYRGKGNTVTIVKHTRTNRVSVIKKIQIQKREHSLMQQKSPKNEIEMLKKVTRHENIVDLYGVHESSTHIMLCMEFMNASLRGVFMKIHEAQKIFPELLLGGVSVKILNALNFCYQVKLIHRDIKPDNILINWTGEIKLSDFGESRFMIDSQVSTNVGTPLYFAPERCLGGKYDIRSDIWSLGITLIECILGKYPFELPAISYNSDVIRNYYVAFEKIKEIEPINLISQCSNRFPKTYSSRMYSFLLLILEKEYEKRPSYDQIMEAIFYKDSTKILKEEIVSILQEYKEE